MESWPMLSSMPATATATDRTTSPAHLAGTATGAIKGDGLTLSSLRRWTPTPRGGSMAGA